MVRNKLTFYSFGLPVGVVAISLALVALFGDCSVPDVNGMASSCETAVLLPALMSGDVNGSSVTRLLTEALVAGLLSTLYFCFVLVYVLETKK